MKGTRLWLKCIIVTRKLSKLDTFILAYLIYIYTIHYRYVVLSTGIGFRLSTYCHTIILKLIAFDHFFFFPAPKLKCSAMSLEGKSPDCDVKRLDNGGSIPNNGACRGTRVLHEIQIETFEGLYYYLQIEQYPNSMVSLFWKYCMLNFMVCKQLHPIGYTVSSWRVDIYSHEHVRKWNSDLLDAQTGTAVMGAKGQR